MRSSSIRMVAVLLLCSCADPSAPVASSPPSAPSSESAPAPAGDRRFDALTFTLTLAATEVRSGEELKSAFVVRNDSGTTVTDPGCWIGANRYAISKTERPAHDEMFAITVDCSGPHVMPDGYESEGMGPGFRAARPDTTPLPPGEYFAVMSFRGLSEPLTQPVTVTAGPPAPPTPSPIPYQDPGHGSPDPVEDGDAIVGQPYEYRLWTHCGIEFALFNGSYWRTTRQTDAHGASPPRGWDDPEQLGTMTLLGSEAVGTEAEFRDSRGHRVVFGPTTRQPPPCD